MKRISGKFCLLASSLILLPLLVSQTAHATPHFAVYANTSCSHCHVNPTGGGMRSSHGVNLYSEFSLKKSSPLFPPEFKGRVGQYFGIGGDVRLQNLSTIESPTNNSFTILWGSLYLAADPHKHLTIYTDTDLANTTSREAYGMVHHLPGNSWFKFGRLNQPYGLRVPDPTSFIRSDLGFTFANQDLGVEIGAEPGPLTLALALTNGVGGGAGDDNQAKAITWFSEWRKSILRFGGSVHFNDAQTTRLLTGGAHSGLHLGKVALLGEVDRAEVRNKTNDTDRTITLGYGEINYAPIQGLYCRGIYDVEDDNLAPSGLHHRIGGGVEFFPIPFMEVNLLYRMQIGNGTLGDDQIVGQLHGFF
ncbi:MAG: hypothetical protein HYT77_04755 [Deltaproteobacteria bacterium]|nr:hypothetical protein [Deltaproteobacteria bacterium]